MKKANIFLIAIIAALASCRDANGKLPNASITGETPWDLVPWWMMAIGALFLVFTAYNEITNRQAFIDKTKNPAVYRFVFGVGGALLLIMGFVIKS